MHFIESTKCLTEAELTSISKCVREVTARNLEGALQVLTDFRFQEYMFHIRFEHGMRDNHESMSEIVLC